MNKHYSLESKLGYQDDAVNTLGNHGKSFYFARLFLGKAKGNAAARLYSFCRYCDDIADENYDKNLATHQLSLIQSQIKQRQSSVIQVLDFLDLCSEFDIQPEHGIVLIDGLLQDQKSVLIKTEDELIQYAYKVAGIVGLMMSQILGASVVGRRHAMDLGIAMQLTNIARDLMEDADMNRRYIPGEWLNHLTPQQIRQKHALDSFMLNHCLVRLLSLAEKYYDSGFNGLFYLPKDSKPSIAIAGAVYREIGVKILKDTNQALEKRVVVSTSRKCSVAIKTLLKLYFSDWGDQRPAHNNRLHKPIAHLIRV